MHLKSLQILIITDCLWYFWEDRYQNGLTSGLLWHVPRLIILFLTSVISANIILFIIEHPVLATFYLLIATCFFLWYWHLHLAKCCLAHATWNILMTLLTWFDLICINSLTFLTCFAWCNQLAVISLISLTCYYWLDLIYYISIAWFFQPDAIKLIFSLMYSTCC